MPKYTTVEITRYERDSPAYYFEVIGLHQYHHARLATHSICDGEISTVLDYRYHHDKSQANVLAA